MNDDPDYWERNARARLEQSSDFEPEAFEFEVPDAAYSSVVLELTRTDDVDEWNDDEWTRFIVTLQRGGFEVTTNETRPVEGVYLLERSDLDYPYAQDEA